MTDITTLWHYRRPKVAEALAARLEAHERIAMFGPRQTGKTTLLREEVMPALEKRGVLPIYVECWADRNDPMSAINHALTKAFEGIELAPARKGRRLARTPVRKVGAFGASLELGELAERSLPERPTLRFDALLTRLLEVTKQDVALVFDEFQVIAEVAAATQIAAGLRAALAQADKRVGAVFSGSSQTLLLGMFTTSRAPLYSFADAIAYPLLKQDFVGHVAARFRQATRRDLNQAMALGLLEELGHQPAAFLQVVGNAMSDPKLTLHDALRVMLSRRADSPWAVAWRSLTALQRATLRAVAEQLAPTSADTLQGMAAALRQTRITASSVNRALKSLQARGLVDKGQRYEVIDPVMRAWLAANGDLPLDSQPS